MLHNYINWHDRGLVREAARRAVRQGPRAVAASLRRSRTARVQAAWQEPDPAPTEWWAVPGMPARWATLITGDPATDWAAAVLDRYLAGRHDLVGLNLGCGDGINARRWAAFHRFARLDGVDISPERIAFARQAAQVDGLATVLHYQVADVYTVDWPAQQYDLIIGEQSIHHFTPLTALFERIARWLKPDGYFVLNEFVGPTRFQWTERQLAAINALLALLPPAYKRLPGGGPPKPPVYRPSVLSMLRADPSEAVESARILPLLPKYFDVLEVRPYGGGVLHLLFSGIAQNFRADDPVARRWVQVCMEVEDLLTASGDVANDFAIIVCRPRGIKRGAQDTHASLRSAP